MAFGVGGRGHYRRYSVSAIERTNFATRTRAGWTVSDHFDRWALLIKVQHLCCKDADDILKLRVRHNCNVKDGVRLPTATFSGVNLCIAADKHKSLGGPLMPTTKPPRRKKGAFEYSWFMDLVSFQEAGTIKKAASQTGRAEGTVRDHLKELNRHLHKTLVQFPAEGEAPNKHATLTEEGARVANAVKAQFGQLLNEIASGQAKRHVRIASLQSLASGYLPVRLSDQYPRLGTHEFGITILTGNFDRCMRALDSGKANLVACYQDATTTAHLSTRQLESMSLGEEQLLPVCSKDLLPKLRPILECHFKPSLKRVEKSSFPFLAYSTDTYLGPVVANHLQDLGIYSFAQSFAEADMADTLKSLALCDQGVCWLPKTLAKPALEDGRLHDLAKQFSAPRAVLDLKVVLLGTHEMLSQFRIHAVGA